MTRRRFQVPEVGSGPEHLHNHVVYVENTAQLNILVPFHFSVAHSAIWGKQGWLPYHFRFLPWQIVCSKDPILVMKHTMGHRWFFVTETDEGLCAGMNQYCFACSALRERFVLLQGGERVRAVSSGHIPAV